MPDNEERTIFQKRIENKNFLLRRIEMIDNEEKEEIQDILKELGSTVFDSSKKDRENLQAYSNFLISKFNKEMLNTIKKYNKIIIGFGALNLVFAFINLYLFFNL